LKLFPSLQAAIVSEIPQTVVTSRSLAAVLASGVVGLITIIIAAIAVLVVIGCGNGKVAKEIDQKTMEKVAQIAAMVEIDEGKALLMLKAEGMSVDQYTVIMAEITLDPVKTDKFVGMKKIYVEQYKK